MAKKEKEKADKPKSDKFKPRFLAEFKGQKLDVDGTLFATPCGRDLLVVRVAEYRKKKSLDIRRLWMTDGETWAPGKGASIPADVAPAFLAKISDPKFVKDILALLGE